MNKKIIDKNIPPSCEYCSHRSTGENDNFCTLTSAPITVKYCKKFSYDPLRRVPRQEPRLPVFSIDSFKLD